MIEIIQGHILANPLEFYTAVIATLGVAFWAIDRRSMKAALKAAKVVDRNALRLERQKADANVERSLLELQMRCQETRNAWQTHGWRNGPTLGSGLFGSDEQREVGRVERAGRLLLEQLQNSAPPIDNSEIEELETYLNAADRTSMEITRLTLQLPEPNGHVH